MARVFLQLGHDADSDVHWFVADGTHGQGSINDAATWLRSREHAQPIVALVPGEEVLLTSASIPAGAGRKRLQALPYALEDQLSEDLDDLHIVAPAAVNGDDRIPAAVVAREKISQWQQLLIENGIYPESMVPDVLSLPCKSGTWSICRQDDRYLVRTGTFSGLVVDQDNLALALRLALQDEVLDSPAEIHILGDISDSIISSLPADLKTVIENGTSPDAEFVQGYSKDTVINLLQGDYLVRKPVAHAKRYWRLAVSLLIAWLLIETGMTVVDNLRLQAESDKLALQIESIYKDAFPGSVNVPDPKLLMERKLRTLGAAGNQQTFLTMLGFLGQGLARSGNSSIERITYSNDILDAYVAIDSIQRLDVLKQHFAGVPAYTSEIKNARTENGKVNVHLRIRGKQ
jgi:general secretion pathway protein L